MIDYTHNSFGLSWEFWSTVVGSALPRASVAATVSLAIYFVVNESHELKKETLRHPYALGMVASIISFSVIFRSNSAIARYNEAASVTHQMYSKWGDVVVHCCSFHGQRNRDTYKGVNFVERLTHLFSLTLGLACMTLRQDTDTHNICKHIPDEGDIPRHAFGAKPYRENMGLWGWLKYVFGMRSAPSTRVNYYRYTPVPVLGGISPSEQAALDLAKGGYAKQAVCLYWINDLINTEIRLGAFGDVAQPILSRLYQELSDGMAGFNQARKIAYLPFPFVYAQSAEFLMMFGMVLVPLLMNGFINSELLGALMTFFTVLSFFVLYESCRELEDPFLYEPNDLPLRRWQSSFNEMLLSVCAQVELREKDFVQSTVPIYLSPVDIAKPTQM